MQRIKHTFWRRFGGGVGLALVILIGSAHLAIKTETGEMSVISINFWPLLGVLGINMLLSLLLGMTLGWAIWGTDKRPVRPSGTGGIVKVASSPMPKVSAAQQPERQASGPRNPHVRHRPPVPQTRQQERMH